MRVHEMLQVDCRLVFDQWTVLWRASELWLPRRRLRSSVLAAADRVLLAFHAGVVGPSRRVRTSGLSGR
jgi:hypothetical protein